MGPVEVLWDGDGVNPPPPPSRVDRQICSADFEKISHIIVLLCVLLVLPTVVSNKVTTYLHKCYNTSSSGSFMLSFFSNKNQLHVFIQVLLIN